MLKLKINLILKFFLRVFMALLLSLIPVIWVIQDDARIQKTIKTALINILETEWDAKISAQDSDVNLFTGTIVFKKGSVKSSNETNQDFCWNFEKAYIRFSRLKYLLKNKINLDITFDNIKSESVFKDGDIVIKKHLENIFTPSTKFLVKIKSLTIHNLALILKRCSYPSVVAEAMADKSTGSGRTDCFKELAVRPEEPAEALAKAGVSKGQDERDLNIFLKLDGDFYLKEIKTSKNKKYWQGCLLLANGDIAINNKILLKEINGFASFYEDIIFGTNGWFFKFNKKFKCFDCDYALNGGWDADKHEVALIDKSKTFNTRLTLNESSLFKISGTLPLNLTKQFYDFWNNEQGGDNNITGTCNFDVALNVDKSTQSSGKLKLDDVKYNDFGLGNFDLNFEQVGNEVALDGRSYPSIHFASQNTQDERAPQGDRFEWSQRTNLTPPVLPELVEGSSRTGVKLHDFYTKVKINNNFDLLGEYKLNLTSQNSKKLSFQGNYFFKENTLKISGKKHQGSYLLQAKLEPRFYLTKLLYIQKGKKSIDLAVDSDGSTTLQGNIKYSFLKSFFPTNLKRTILGKSSFLNLKLNQNDYNNLTGSVLLSEARICLPASYNLIENIKFDFGLDFISKQCVLHNAQIDFFKGKISSPKATVLFNDDYSIDFVHAPVQIDDLLINWKRDFYGFVYGNLLLSKQKVLDWLSESHIKVSGDLILKKSLIKENLLAGGFADSSFETFVATDASVYDDQVFDFDVNISNQSPVKAKTSFLETDANFDLNLKALYVGNKVLMPQLTGNVNLKKGSLNFLHHKLFIDYGRVQFIPNQMNDPIIDLVAKNKIKKYLISLHATGSLQKPNIILESSPELTEEEILALLVAGSENVSLQAELPSILMQNLSNLIMGSKFILPRTSNFFRKLTLPFKYVQITPNFTDQSGHGGIKGTVSIDLSKQIHAQIQKNFNLQEDFAFQLEYFLTDDINLKMVKDQSGDIGSEVEVRLKF